MKFDVRRPGILYDDHNEVPRESVYADRVKQFVELAVPVIESAFKTDRYLCILVCYFDRPYNQVIITDDDFLMNRLYPGSLLRSASDQLFYQYLQDANFDVRIVRVITKIPDGDDVHRVGLVVFEYEGALLDEEAARKLDELIEYEPLPTEVHESTRTLVCA